MRPSQSCKRPRFELDTQTSWDLITTHRLLKTGCVVLLPLVWTVVVVSVSAVYLTRPSSAWVQPSPDNLEDIRDAVRAGDEASSTTRRRHLKSSFDRTTDSTARPTSDAAKPRVGVTTTSSPEGVELVNRSGTVICVINVTRLVVPEASPPVVEPTSTASSSSVQDSSVTAGRVSNVGDRADSSSITTEKRVFSESTRSSTVTAQAESSARPSVKSSGELSSSSTSGSFSTGDQRDSTAADFGVDATSRKSPSSEPTATFSASTSVTAALTYGSKEGTNLEHLGTPSPSLASLTSSTTFASLTRKLTSMLVSRSTANSISSTYESLATSASTFNENAESNSATKHSQERSLASTVVSSPDITTVRPPGSASAASPTISQSDKTESTANNASADTGLSVPVDNKPEATEHDSRTSEYDDYAEYLTSSLESSLRPSQPGALTSKAGDDLFTLSYNSTPEGISYIYFGDDITSTHVDDRNETLAADFEKFSMDTTSLPDQNTSRVSYNYTPEGVSYIDFGDDITSSQVDDRNETVATDFEKFSMDTTSLPDQNNSRVSYNSTPEGISYIDFSDDITSTQVDDRNETLATDLENLPTDATSLPDLKSSRASQREELPASVLTELFETTDEIEVGNASTTTDFVPSYVPTELLATIKKREQMEETSTTHKQTFEADSRETVYLPSTQNTQSAESSRSQSTWKGTEGAGRHTKRVTESSPILSTTAYNHPTQRNRLTTTRPPSVSSARTLSSSRIWRDHTASPSVSQKGNSDASFKDATSSLFTPAQALVDLTSATAGQTHWDNEQSFSTAYDSAVPVDLIDFVTMLSISDENVTGALESTQDIRQSNFTLEWATEETSPQQSASLHTGHNTFSDPSFLSGEMTRDNNDHADSENATYRRHGEDFTEGNDSIYTQLPLFIQKGASSEEGTSSAELETIVLSRNATVKGVAISTATGPLYSSVASKTRNNASATSEVTLGRSTSSTFRVAHSKAKIASKASVADVTTAYHESLSVPVDTGNQSMQNASKEEQWLTDGASAVYSMSPEESALENSFETLKTQTYGAYTTAETMVNRNSVMWKFDDSAVHSGFRNQTTLTRAGNRNITQTATLSDTAGMKHTLVITKAAAARSHEDENRELRANLHLDRETTLGEAYFRNLMKDDLGV